MLTLEPRFDSAEKLVATRISLLRATAFTEKPQTLGVLQTPMAAAIANQEVQLLTQLAEKARLSENLQIALNCVVRAQSLEKIPSPRVIEEFAFVLWSQNEQKLAVELLRDLLDRPSIASWSARRPALMAKLVWSLLLTKGNLLMQ